MKCLYAMHTELADDAKQRTDAYAAALATLSSDVARLADGLADYAETFAAAKFRLADGDWAQIRMALRAAGGLAGLLWWTQDEVLQARDVVMAQGGDTCTADTDLCAWLDAQAKRKLGVMLLAA